MDDPTVPFSKRHAPLILIWPYLVNQMGVDPAGIAVYADLKTDVSTPWPEEFTSFRVADKHYESFTAGDYRHIIFNPGCLLCAEVRPDQVRRSKRAAV